jgi:Flp pilus assembly protein TadG
MQKRPDREHGTAAVEFALVLPLVLLVALALVQTGLLVRDRLLVEADAVRSAAVGAAPSLDGAALTVSIERSGARGEPGRCRSW